MSIELIKSIRSSTGLSFKDIKKAIEEVGGTDEQSIIDHLRKQGALKAAKRSDRQTNEGGIFSYIHDGRLGVMVQVKCETDFVARGDDFKALGKDLAMHVAAVQPQVVSADEVDTAFVDKELEIAKQQLEDEGKSAEIIEKILVGKKKKVTEEVALVSQKFFKDETKTIEDLVNEVSAATGEKITVEKFVTYTM